MPRYLVRLLPLIVAACAIMSASLSYAIVRASRPVNAGAGQQVRAELPGAPRTWKLSLYTASSGLASEHLGIDFQLPSNWRRVAHKGPGAMFANPGLCRALSVLPLAALSNGADMRQTGQQLLAAVLNSSKQPQPTAAPQITSTPVTYVQGKHRGTLAGVTVLDLSQGIGVMVSPLPTGSTHAQVAGVVVVTRAAANNGCSNAAGVQAAHDVQTLLGSSLRLHN